MAHAGAGRNCHATGGRTVGRGVAILRRSTRLRGAIAAPLDARGGSGADVLAIASRVAGALLHQLAAALKLGLDRATGRSSRFGEFGGDIATFATSTATKRHVILATIAGAGANRVTVAGAGDTLGSARIGTRTGGLGAGTGRLLAAAGRRALGVGGTGLDVLPRPADQELGLGGATSGARPIATRRNFSTLNNLATALVLDADRATATRTFGRLDRIGGRVAAGTAGAAPSQALGNAQALPKIADVGGTGIASGFAVGVALTATLLGRADALAADLAAVPVGAWIAVAAGGADGSFPFRI